MPDRVSWRPSTGITRARGASRSTGPSMSGIMRAPGVGQIGGGGLPPVGGVVSEESWSSSPSPEELREILYRDADFMDLGNQAPGVTNPFDQITPAVRHELPEDAEQGMHIPGSMPTKSRMDPSTWGYGHIPTMYASNKAIGSHAPRAIRKFEKMSKRIQRNREENPDWTFLKNVSEDKESEYETLRNRLVNAGIREGLYRDYEGDERYQDPYGARNGGLMRRGYFEGGAIAPGGLGEILTQETAVETPLGDTFTEETITPYGESFAEETVIPEDPGMVFEAARAAVEDKLSGVELSPEASMAADEAINAFVAQNGEEELGALVAAVQAEMAGEEVPGGEEMFAEEEVYESPDGLIEESMGVLGEAQGFRHGGAIRGPGDGMSDSISASIDRAEPIAVSSGETIIPADAVSALGNGSTDAGARELMDMVDRIRMAKTGSSQQPRSINPRRSLIA